MEVFEIKPPSDKEIEEAQERLGFTFPLEYIEFIKSGYDLGDAALEALEVSNPQSHVDIFEALVKMKNENIRHLPVVDGKKLLGLLTLKDILKKK